MGAAGQYGPDRRDAGSLPAVAHAKLRFVRSHDSAAGADLLHARPQRRAAVDSVGVHGFPAVRDCEADVHHGVGSLSDVPQELSATDGVDRTVRDHAGADVLDSQAAGPWNFAVVHPGSVHNAVCSRRAVSAFGDDRDVGRCDGAGTLDRHEQRTAIADRNGVHSAGRRAGSDRRRISPASVKTDSGVRRFGWQSS